MSLVYDHHPSGLVVAHQGAGEADVRRALKAFDPRLLLDYAIDREWQRQVWQVLCRHHPDHPPVVVCRWRDDQTGEPLPLSHGLVEKVRRLHSDTRAPIEDPEAANRRLVERHQADSADEIEFYAEELVERLKGKKGHLLPRGAHRRRRQFPNVTEIR